MAAVWLRFRSELRTRWRAWLVLAGLVGLSAGVVLTAVAGARRGASSYDRLVEWSNGHDIFVFGQSFELDLDAVARLPEVAEVAPVGYVFLAGPAPETGLQVTPLVSLDGRFLDRIDRPKLLDGRRPRPDRADEIAITPPIARSRGLSVGDTITMRGYALDQLGDIFGQGAVPNPSGPEVKLHVVGIEVAPTEGELVSSTRSQDNIHLTPAFAREYRGTIAMGEALFVRLDGGSQDLPAFRAGVERIASGTPVQLSSQADESEKVRRSIRLQAVALAMFGGLAGVAAVLTLGQALTRQAAVVSGEDAAVRALGMTTHQLWATAMLRTGAITAVGAVVACAIAIAASPLMPIGLARIVEPDAGVSVDVLVLGLGLLLIPAVTLAATALPTWRAARASVPGRREVAASGRPTPVAERLAGSGAPPSVVAGVRLAMSPGMSGAPGATHSAIAGATVSLALLTAVLVFGSSLGRLFNTPRMYGWNWDITVGNAYLPDVADRVVPILRQSSSVGGFSAVAVAEIDVSGVRTHAVGFETVQGEVLPPIMRGRPPRQPDEIVLGAKTLQAADRDVGDLVEVRVGDVSATARVVGTAVFPTLGQFDVGGLGAGALLTVEGMRRVLPGAARNVFPVIVSAGSDRDEALAALTRDFEQLTLTLPSAPVEVADFDRIDNMPAVLSGVFAVIAAATMTHALLSTVRRRRRDLAILKTLGFVRQQVRSTVAWQATTMTVVSLIAGIPLGLVTGRWVWHVFADGLGIVPESVVPLLAVILVVPASLLVANAVAALPAWSAARMRPADALRTE